MFSPQHCSSAPALPYHHQHQHHHNDRHHQSNAMSINIVMNSEIYNELSRRGQRPPPFPTVEVDARELHQYKRLRVAWRLKNFVDVLERFTGEYGTKDEWTVSPMRLAFVFGQFTQGLGFKFLYRTFSVEARRGVLKMNDQCQRRVLLRTVGAILLGTRHRNHGKVSMRCVWKVPVDIDFRQSAGTLFLGDTCTSIVPDVPVYEEAPSFPWSRWLQRIDHLFTLITGRPWQKRQQAFHRVHHLAGIQGAIHLPEWFAAGLDGNIPMQNFPTILSAKTRYQRAMQVSTKDLVSGEDIYRWWQPPLRQPSVRRNSLEVREFFKSNRIRLTKNFWAAVDAKILLVLKCEGETVHQKDLFPEVEGLVMSAVDQNESLRAAFENEMVKNEMPAVIEKRCKHLICVGAICKRGQQSYEYLVPLVPSWQHRNAACNGRGSSSSSTNNTTPANQIQENRRPAAIDMTSKKRVGSSNEAVSTTRTSTKSSKRFKT